MGASRFLYNNKITSTSTITPSSQRTGLVSAAIKDNSAGSTPGSATITTAGAFTGTADLDFTVEIDSIAGGAEVGQATFKWSDGGGTWDATGVTTSAVAVTLTSGVTVYWTTAAGADFVVGDRWRFKAYNLFNAAKSIDRNRDTRHRTAALASPNTWIFDLESAQSIQALCILDHNFTSAATIVIEGNSADAWGAPAVQESVTWVTGSILHFLAAAYSYRYWRLSVTDAANSDTYLEFSEIYLGPYFEPAASFDKNAKEPWVLIKDSTVNGYGVLGLRYYNQGRKITPSFPLISRSEESNFATMLSTIASKSAKTFNPVYFCPDVDYTSEFYLMDVLNADRTRVNNGFRTVGLELSERLRSVE